MFCGSTKSEHNRKRNEGTSLKQVDVKRQKKTASVGKVKYEAAVRLVLFEPLSFISHFEAKNE